MSEVRLLEILSQFNPDPFSIGAKNIVTDESFTQDEVLENETAHEDVNFQHFAEKLKKLKTAVN